jgi:hypothetical protein
MKIFLLALFTIFELRAACTTISRTNSGANTVLTSTKYNTDLNTVYAAVNSIDGECIQDDSIGAAALNPTDFAFLNKGIHQGCKLSKSNDSTISVDRCHLSVGGNFVSTSSATTQSFGCSGCSAEVANTLYYAYAKSTSTGSTLDLLISTSAPNADGFNGSNDKVIGSFVNDSSGNIDAYAINPWVVSGLQQKTKVMVSGYWPGATNCLWSRSSATMGALTVDTDCVAPVFDFTAGPGQAIVSDTDLPKLSLLSVPPGQVEVTFTGFSRVGGGGAMAGTIFDGTTSCPGTALHSSASLAPFTITCIFNYTSVATRTYELYMGASGGNAVNIDNNTVSPTSSGLRFIVKHLGDND